MKPINAPDETSGGPKQRDTESNVSTPLQTILKNERLNWLSSVDIRPYVFVRPENRIESPGELHHLDWFPQEVLYKNPLEMDQVGFADLILTLETKAFGPSGMEMPRWVFYDCAIMPGFVAGFAHRTATLPPAVRQVLNAGGQDEQEWTPLSLFIIIPTMSRSGEWVAHNLCSVNSLLAKNDQFYGIGFISKAFGLWYANVRTCCGMTQWGSPAVRLHSHYGDFEILTAFTPVHSYSRTLTYRVKVDVTHWSSFFEKDASDEGFLANYQPAGFMLDPGDESSLISFQRRLERKEGPYFLHGAETIAKKLTDPLTIYSRK